LLVPCGCLANLVEPEWLQTAIQEANFGQLSGSEVGMAAVFWRGARLMDESGSRLNTSGCGAERMPDAFNFARNSGGKVEEIILVRLICVVGLAFGLLILGVGAIAAIWRLRSWS
jgi:hypothetical protein